MEDELREFVAQVAVSSQILASLLHGKPYEEISNAKDIDKYVKLAQTYAKKLGTEK